MVINESIRVSFIYLMILIMTFYLLQYENIVFILLYTLKDQNIFYLL